MTRGTYYVCRCLEWSSCKCTRHVQLPQPTLLSLLSYDTDIFPAQERIPERWWPGTHDIWGSWCWFFSEWPRTSRAWLLDLITTIRILDSKQCFILRHRLYVITFDMTYCDIVLGITTGLQDCQYVIKRRVIFGSQLILAPANSLVISADQAAPISISSISSYLGTFTLYQQTLRTQSPHVAFSRIRLIRQHRFRQRATIE